MATTNALFCPQCGLALPKNARFCHQCVSSIPEVAVVEQPSVQHNEDHVPRGGFYPNKSQWWAIWITAGIVGLGLLSTGESIGLVAVALWGGLLVWQLSRRGPSGRDSGKHAAAPASPANTEPTGLPRSRPWSAWSGIGVILLLFVIVGAIVNSNSVHQTSNTYRPKTYAQPVEQTSPQTVRDSEVQRLAQPAGAGPRPGTAKRQQTPRDHFTIGSSVAEVLRVQGTPTEVNDFGISKTYWWGLSNVAFKDGRVSEFSNLGGNLRVRVSEPIERKPHTAQGQPSPALPDAWQDDLKQLQQASALLACEPYRAKYDQLRVGDPWTRIAQLFGPSTTAEDTPTGETIYTYELSDCRLTFRAGSDAKLADKQMNSRR